MDGLDESLPLTPERKPLLARIIRRLKRLIVECEQIIRDYEYWASLPHNVEHAHEIDIEDDRVMLADLRRKLEQAERIWNRGW